MTVGALIFAFNNEHTDYVAMANWSANNIHRHLNIPVCVVTREEPADGHSFDKVILADPSQGGTRYFSDYNSNVTWHNTNRMDAYRLSSAFAKAVRCLSSLNNAPLATRGATTA